MTPSGISDQRSPDSTKIGAWLFRHRTAIPLPFALLLLLVRTGEAPFSWTLVLPGLILTSTGELIRLWSVRHIGVVSRTRSTRLGPLVSTGPFAIVRNPLYIGNVLLWVGFAFTARLVWMAPVVIVLLALEYDAIVRWEENLLTMRYGEEYQSYARRVHRWLPTIPPRAPEQATARFPWRETLFSERGTLLAIAGGYVLLWIKARF